MIADVPSTSLLHPFFFSRPFLVDVPKLFEKGSFLDPIAIGASLQASDSPSIIDPPRAYFLMYRK